MLLLHLRHRRAFAIAALALALAACNTRPFMRQGDADSVEVGYAGDVEMAFPVARKHCARFERVPQLLEFRIDTAYFNCIRG